MPLQIISVPLSAVAADPHNARQHNERNLRQLAASVKRFGQQKPVVVREVTKEDAFAPAIEYVCVAGSGMREAVEQAGFKDIDLVVTTLEDYEAVAYAIADNQTALTSEWDFKILAGHLSAIKELEGEAFDLESLGFTDFEVQPMLASDVWRPAAEEAGALDNMKAVDKTKPIKLSADQRQIFESALARVKEDAGSEDFELSEGRAVEFLSIEYLNSPRDPDSQQAAE